jgi:beta-glucanase (GH16 family)
MKLQPIMYYLASTSFIIGGMGHAIAQQCQTTLWEDDFSGSTLNSSAWETQLGDGCDQGAGMCGWGNSEEQSYQADNLSIANGILTIEARKQRIKSTQYTSGRIRTSNMPESGEWAFGRFEARMKVPDGQGMWPAFWMLPTNPAQAWPMSGEMDIYESVGQSANMAYGTIHYGQPWPDNSHQGGQMLMQPGKWSDNFHIYAMEWEQDEIRWYVDNVLYSTKTRNDVLPEDWPFDGRNNFHLILNLAVGGTWGGVVDDSALPQQLQIDYVKVYGGSQPNISGDHLPTPGTTVSYAVENPGSSTTWTVTGGTISGSGSTIDVTWDSGSAGTTQTLTAVSDSCEISTNIYVGKVLTTETILEDYDGNSNMTVVSSTGDYSSANGVLTYVRDATSQWDVIAANSVAVPNAQPFLIGEKAFEVDFNNTDSALVGKEILIQLEDNTVATPSNYPGGRHSKYQAFINNANGWQTLRFKLLERLDGATSDISVNSILFLIDPDAFSADTYTLDNIHIVGASTNSSPTAVITNSCSDLACNFNGSNSVDNDGSIVSYSWDFGDTNTGSTAIVDHTYAQPGDYTVTLTVTDDQGAVNVTTTQVTVTSGTSEEATSIVISDVTTGTQGAGKGKKYGLASATVLDNLGNPIAGAVVTGTFSGTWNETVDATTDSSGIASFLTSSTASGGVTVNFCVNDASSTLPLDITNSSGMCQ